MLTSNITALFLFQCLEAEFYSWVAYGEGIASINSTLVGAFAKLTAAVSLLSLCHFPAYEPELFNLAGNSSAGLKTTNSGATARAADPEAFSATTIAIATEIAENEIAHVRYLRAAITAAGGTAVSIYWG